MTSTDSNAGSCFDDDQPYFFDVEISNFEALSMDSV
jgi:hypothetical protein